MAVKFIKHIAIFKETRKSILSEAGEWVALPITGKAVDQQINDWAENTGIIIEGITPSFRSMLSTDQQTLTTYVEYVVVWQKYENWLGMESTLRYIATKQPDKELLDKYTGTIEDQKKELVVVPPKPIILEDTPANEAIAIKESKELQKLRKAPTVAPDLTPPIKLDSKNDAQNLTGIPIKLLKK